MEPSQVKKPKWQRILDLEAQARDLDSSQVEAPLTREQIALNQLIREQKKTNMWLALQPVLMHPFRFIMGGIIVYILLKVWTK